MGVGEGVRKNGEKEGEKPPNTHANKNKVQTNATTIAAVALWVGKITKPKISNQICGCHQQKAQNRENIHPLEKGRWGVAGELFGGQFFYPLSVCQRNECNNATIARGFRGPFSPICCCNNKHERTRVFRGFLKSSSFFFDFSCIPFVFILFFIHIGYFFPEQLLFYYAFLGNSPVQAEVV